MLVGDGGDVDCWPDKESKYDASELEERAAAKGVLDGVKALVRGEIAAMVRAMRGAETMVAMLFVEMSAEVIDCWHH